MKEERAAHRARLPSLGFCGWDEDSTSFVVQFVEQLIIIDLPVSGCISEILLEFSCDGKTIYLFEQVVMHRFTQRIQQQTITFLSMDIRNKNKMKWNTTFALLQEKGIRLNVHVLQVINYFSWMDRNKRTRSEWWKNAAVREH